MNEEDEDDLRHRRENPADYGTPVPWTYKNGVRTLFREYDTLFTYPGRCRVPHCAYVAPNEGLAVAHVSQYHSGSTTEFSLSCLLCKLRDRDSRGKKGRSVYI